MLRKLKPMENNFISIPGFIVLLNLEILFKLVM